jgi:dihydroorotase
MDILIKDGRIEKIGASIKSTDIDQEIKINNLHVSVGWFDSSVSFGEPGFEERGTILNGLITAAKSGYTQIALNPATDPVTDDNGAVTSIISKAKNNAVKISPIGALTKNSEGKDLAELYDMHQAGAIAFGDYKKAVMHSNLLKLALQYSQNFNGLVLSYPQDNQIAGKGIVNEDVNSTYLGLKGIPALAEELQIIRDLYILEYTGGKIHIPTISTEKSVKLIREAKKKGLDVSCSVAIHNLIFTDEELKEFDTNAKVLPPLRTKKDISALIKGLKDGTIDMVTSDHFPVDPEHKKIEFEHALFGSIGLESSFGALLQVFSLDESIGFLTGSRKRFGLKTPVIKEGKKANLSLFSPDGTYNFTMVNIYSTSRNSLFMNKKLSGKVFGIVSGKQIILSK